MKPFDQYLHCIQVRYEANSARGLSDYSKSNLKWGKHDNGTVYSMEWSIGVQSNFGVVKILFTPADSVYLSFSNIWTVVFFN